MKNKLNLSVHMMESKNQLLSNVFQVMWEERRGEWVKQLEKYLEEVGVGIMELRIMSKEKIKLRVHGSRWGGDRGDMSSPLFESEGQSIICPPNFLNDFY